MIKRNFSFAIIMTIVIMSSCIKPTQQIYDSNNNESKVLKRKEVKLRDDVDYMIIEGNIKDIETKEELPFINIGFRNISNNENFKSTSTDKYGNFSFLIDKEGKYTIHVKTLGYKEINIDSINFEKGKNIKLNIGLKTTYTRLEEIYIDGKDK